MYHTKKRIKGRYYWYLQHSRREGKRVRTTSIYVAPVGASVRVLKVGLVLATSKLTRNNAFGEVKFKEPVQKEAFTVNFVGGDKLGFRSALSPVDLFEHESGTKDAYHDAAPSSEGHDSGEKE